LEDSAAVDNDAGESRSAESWDGDLDALARRATQAPEAGGGTVRQGRTLAGRQASGNGALLE